MSTHVKILGILHVVFGSLCLLFGLAIFAFFGGIAGLVGATDHSGDAWIAVPILGSIGTIALVFFSALAFPGIIAGVGLLNHQKWARILTIVLSALHLLNVPFGTLLGIYGLWVLLSNETERLFEGHPVRV